MIFCITDDDDVPDMKFIGPGHDVHSSEPYAQVIMLDQYLGLGSFHAGLPGFPCLLSHWAKFPPYWSEPFKPGKRIARIHHSARHTQDAFPEDASQIEQYRWGLPQMIVALRTDVPVGRPGRSAIYRGGTSKHQEFLVRSVLSLAFRRSIF
jgi:hypothetical protein